MASSSAAPPDGTASGTSDEIDSFFLPLKFRMLMSHKMIKKLLQESSTGGGNTREIRDRKSEQATLAHKFNALLFFEFGDIGNEFIPNFMDLDPRKTVIALKDLEKEGNLNALISGFEVLPKKVDEIEDAIRVLGQKWTNVSENYAWILYLRFRSAILTDHLEEQSKVLQSVEEKEEMERLKAEFKARKAELEEFGGRIRKCEDGFLQMEMGDLAEEMGRLLKARIGVGDYDEEEIGDQEKRLRELKNALFLSADQDDLDLSSFRKKMGEFDRELNAIGDKVFMTSFRLDEAKKKEDEPNVDDDSSTGRG